MTFSLNEIEAMGKRAARGAGMDWGTAEEAGKAARWLTAHGLPGAELLAELLTRNAGESYNALAPVSTNGAWRAASGWLCPLIAGAALSDRADQIAAGSVVQLGPVTFPLLLVPYTALAARACGTSFALTWQGARLAVFPEGGLSVEGGPAAVAARMVDGAECCRAVGAAPTPSTDAPDRSVDAETWSRLDSFARRTFAPATEASRLLGAGAGLTDND